MFILDSQLKYYKKKINSLYNNIKKNSVQNLQYNNFYYIYTHITLHEQDKWTESFFLLQFLQLLAT